MKIIHTAAARIACPLALIAGLSGCVPQLPPTLVQRDFSPAPAGDPLHPGDVLDFSTTFFVATAIGNTPLMPIHASTRIPIRYVDGNGRLLPSESALLQMALLTHRRGSDSSGAQFGGQDLTDDTRKFINEHQAALWDALVQKMIVQESISGHFGELKFDTGTYCTALQTAIKEHESDLHDYTKEINAFGIEVLGSQFAASRASCLNGKFSPEDITGLADLDDASYLDTPPPAGTTEAIAFYGASASFSALNSAVVERAAVRLRNGQGDERLWTLREWEESGICKDISDQPLKIKSVNIGRLEIYIADDDEPPNAEIIQNGGEREFRATGRSPKDLKLLGWFYTIYIDRASLGRLYPSDVRSIEWEPTQGGETAQPLLAKSCL